MSRLPFIWDYEIDESAFRDLLAGRTQRGRLDRDWAATRLLEHAAYRDIRRYLSFGDLVEGWPRWRGRLRSHSRRRGLDFLVSWLTERHPEMLAGTSFSIEELACHGLGPKARRAALL